MIIYKNGYDKYNDEIFKPIESMCDDTTFVEMLDFPESLNPEGDDKFYYKYSGARHYVIDTEKGRQLHVYRLGKSTTITYVDVNSSHEAGITMLEKDVGRAGGSIKAYVTGGFSPVGYYSNSTPENGTDYYCVLSRVPDIPKSIKPIYKYDDKFNMFDEFANAREWPKDITYDTDEKYIAFSSLFSEIRRIIARNYGENEFYGGNSMEDANLKKVTETGSTNDKNKSHGWSNKAELAKRLNQAMKEGEADLDHIIHAYREATENNNKEPDDEKAE